MIAPNSCFESDCNCKTLRIHLPAADQCRANCVYCQFRNNGNLSDLDFPGHSLFVPRGKEALREYLVNRLKLCLNCQLIGVSGPGDILTSSAQLTALVELMNEPMFREITGCICTNGWDFYHARAQLEQWKGLKYITVTINTLKPETCSRFYLTSERSLSFFQDNIDSQIALLKWAAERGVLLKINTVLTEANRREVLSVWRKLNEAAPIHIVNLLPLRGATLSAKQKRDMENVRREIMDAAQKMGFQTKKNCRQCRADSFGSW